MNQIKLITPLRHDDLGILPNSDLRYALAIQADIDSSATIQSVSQKARVVKDYEPGRVRVRRLFQYAAARKCNFIFYRRQTACD